MTRTEQAIENGAKKTLRIDGLSVRYRVKTPAANYEDALARLEQHCEDSLARRAKLDTWLACQPPLQFCDHHHHSGLLNADASSRASQKAGEFVAVYDDCPGCVAARKDALNFQRWTKCGIPANLIGATLDTLDYETEACRANLALCRQFAARPRGFLCLLGENSYGTGKTHIACAILQMRGQGFFITQSDLVNKNRDTYGDRTAPDVQGRCEQTSLLALDEVGVSIGGRDVGQLLYDIVNTRYNQKLPTIFTSNLPEREFSACLGPRLVDRFREATFAVLRFEEDSKRAASNERYLNL